MSNPPAQAGPPRADAQDRVQIAFMLLHISEDGVSTTSLGDLCQCLFTLTVKKCFLACAYALVLTLTIFPVAPSVKSLV